jgi:hypothetical protein
VYSKVAEPLIPDGITDPSKTATCRCLRLVVVRLRLSCDICWCGGLQYRVVDATRSNEERLVGIDVPIGHKVVSDSSGSARRVVTAVQVADMKESRLRIRVVHSSWSALGSSCLSRILLTARIANVVCWR